MKRLATTVQMKELDRIAIEEWKIPSLDLMERAAEAVAEKVLQITEQTAGDRRKAGRLYTRLAYTAGVDSK